MTRRETQARYGNDAFRHEYYASAIDIPIDVLDLEVTLPEAFEATFHGVVFYGGSELIAAEETRRVGTMLNASRHSARLHVEAPKLAFNYAIYWVPLR